MAVNGRRLSRSAPARPDAAPARPDAAAAERDAALDDWANLDEVAAPVPVQDAADGPVYRRRSLEETRGAERERRREGRAGPESRGARLVTHGVTLSYLVFFSLLGTLARLGLAALTRYPGAPVVFSTVWANFGGSVVMGFLAEDRMLFGRGGGGDADADRRDDDEGGKAHLAVKKTVPLYIGLATGFCGSFTSFSSFMRDAFLALSDDLAPRRGRNGGYSVMAMAAVVITTVCVSLGGLFLGAHVALAAEPVTRLVLPRRRVVGRVLDAAGVVLGWGCWLGAVLLSIWPPRDDWRGRATFALVLSPPGCVLRFYLALWLNGRLAAFPLGTFAANVGGTAVLGMAWDLAHVPVGGAVGCQVLQGVADGFCGCLTTVSTWVAELGGLRRRHAYGYGAASVAAALAVLVAVMGGLRWTDGFGGLRCG